MPRRTALIFPAITLILGLLGAMLLAEMGLRLFGIRPLRYPPHEYRPLFQGRFIRATGTWGDGLIKLPSPYANLGVTMGEYVPGATFKIIYGSNPRGYFDKDNSVTHHVNSIGTRGAEASWEKPAHTFRILMLGDSFTFGLGVRDGDTFSSRLERELNEELGGQKARPQEPFLQVVGRRPSAVKCEVINAGCSGYNTRDEVAYLEHRWLRLKPDLVIINFFLNDAYSDKTFLNNGEAEGVYLQPRGLAAYSYLYDLAQHAYEVRKTTRKMEELYRGSYFQDPGQPLPRTVTDKLDWSVSKTALVRAATLAKGKHFRLALVLWPELYHLDSNYPFTPIHRLVMQTCQSLSLPALDLLPTFRGKRDQDLWVHISDHHPNEVAHQMAAESILRFLREQAMLDGNPAPNQQSAVAGNGRLARAPIAGAGAGQAPNE